MEKSEIGRIAEIDRTEHITTTYLIEDGVLVSREVDWKVPRWPLEGSDDFSVNGMIKSLVPILEEDGVLYGAFDGDLLAGIAVFRPRLTKTQAQLVFLHVSNAYRRQGIGTKLQQETERLAIESGAEELYVSATPSESAVGFYKSHGYIPTSEPNPALFELEPDDIHMVKKLQGM